MGIINNLNSFFGNYEDTFYIEKISIDEISISKNGKVIPDTSDLLHDFYTTMKKRPYGIQKKVSYSIWRMIVMSSILTII